MAVARYRPHELPPIGPIAIPRAQGRSLVAQAAPIVGQLHGLFDQAKAVLMLTDPDETVEVALGALAAVFGMTPAETRLSQRLTMGRDLDSAAEELNVTRETARKHLASIFRKTGTRRQAELTALLNRMFAPSPR